MRWELNARAEIWSSFDHSLYGVTLAQTIFYFKVFPGDSLDLKVLVSRHLVLSEEAYLQRHWRFLLYGEYQAVVLYHFSSPYRPEAFSTRFTSTYLVPFFGPFYWKAELKLPLIWTSKYHGMFFAVTIYKAVRFTYQIQATAGEWLAHSPGTGWLD